jgi:hypothetical protein
MNPLLLLAGLAYLSRKKRQKRSVAGTSQTVAFLYQLPNDGYTTTRVAISSGGDEPSEMGIFSTPEKAKSVVQSNGWTIAHDGQVIQLQTRPTG